MNKQDKDASIGENKNKNEKHEFRAKKLGISKQPSPGYGGKRNVLIVRVLEKHPTFILR